MSNLVTHARRELEMIGTEKEELEGMVNIVQAFADMGHSGGSAAWAIPTINALLQYKNLTPLTNNPLEWVEVGESMWQSVRNPEAFSADGGKKYWLLSEGGHAHNQYPIHRSAEYKP